MKEVGFGTLFVQQKIPQKDKIALPYLDSVVWGCSMVNIARTPTPPSNPLCMGHNHPKLWDQLRERTYSQPIAQFQKK